ncbi:MAG: FAD-dependent oxidoreductase [Parasphingorhabdus sp.]
MKSGQEAVIIIGGGIIGISCAHYLVDAGYKVTVIEQGTIAGACSHGNCGYICPSHVLPLTTSDAIWDAARSLFNSAATFRVKPRFDAAFVSWMWQFVKRCNQRDMLKAAGHLHAILSSSMAEYHKLLGEDEMGSQWRRSGLMYVFQTEVGLSDFANTDELLTDQFGVTARRIESAELPELDVALRPDLAGAYLYEGDASIRPDRLSKAWTEKLIRAGVQFVEGCTFLGLEKKTDAVSQIITSHGTMQADHFVLATGAVSAKLAKHFGTDIPIEPGKGYSITMEKPQDGPEYPMLLPEHHVGVTPFDDGLRLGSMMEFVGYDRSIPKSRLQQLRQSTQLYLQSQLPTTNLEEWYGWRPMTWDSLPIIGQVPGFANAYLATGHNMLGLTLAPATGKLISETVQRQTPHIDPEPFSPDRFR